MILKSSKLKGFTLLLTGIMLAGVFTGCGNIVKNDSNDSSSVQEQIKITHVRNATEVVEYAGKKFLIDPMLAAKGSYDPFPNAPREDQKNPLVDLQTSIDSIIDVDAVIVTHLHYDHFDETAKGVLPKDIKIFAQSETDADEIRKSGFLDVEVLQENTIFEGIQLIKTEGEHGRGDMVKAAGPVMGVVFKHASEKTLYVTGDTVWYDAVQNVLSTYNPEIIIANAGDNQFYEGGSLIMGKEDVYELYKAAPNAKIICVHMEAVNHWGLSREELKAFIEEKGMSSNVLVPNDGQVYSF